MAKGKLAATFTALRGLNPQQAQPPPNPLLDWLQKERDMSGNAVTNRQRILLQEQRDYDRQQILDQRAYAEEQERLRLERERVEAIRLKNAEQARILEDEKAAAAANAEADAQANSPQSAGFYSSTQGLSGVLDLFGRWLSSLRRT